MASDLMNVGATGKYYKVQQNGKAQKGLSVGDRVVTDGGTYQILAVNPDGSYKSALYDENMTTRNYRGKYNNDYGPYSEADSSRKETRKKLSDALDEDYRDSVSKDRYEDILSQKPEAYESAYRREMEDILDRLENREDFSYSLDDDILYRQYRDSYMSAGRMAMEDVSGQAAALTGGYGSTYAVSASAGAYENYLSKLSEKIPELYQLSRQAYDAEGDELYRLYSLYLDADRQDYERYRDSVSDWQEERDRYYGEYLDELETARDDYYDRLDILRDAAELESSDYWNGIDRQNDLERLELDREKFEYDKYQDSVKETSGRSSSSSSRGKNVTVSLYDDAMEAYENGGETGLEMYAQKLRGSGYSQSGIDDIIAYVRQYGNGKTASNGNPLEKYAQRVKSSILNKIYLR